MSSQTSPLVVVAGVLGGLLVAVGAYGCVLYDRSLRMQQQAAYMQAALQMVQLYSSRYAPPTARQRAPAL